MSNKAEQLITAEQLAARPDDGNRCELVDGVLRIMSPAGSRHGRIAARLLVRIATHVERLNLGETYAAETGFVIQRDPDTVRAPDVAFVSRSRLEEFAGEVGYLPLAPDLAAEVVSPSDSSSEVEVAVQGWLEAGVRVVLVVDPENSTVREFRAGNSVRVYSRGFIDLDDVLSGFKLKPAELFA